MVKIRLSRVGTKNQGKYRVIVADEQAPRNGKFLEIIGQYNPTVKPVFFDIKTERYNYWLSVGAQPSSAVEKLLTIENTAWKSYFPLSLKI